MDCMIFNQVVLFLKSRLSYGEVNTKIIVVREHIGITFNLNP